MGKHADRFMVFCNAPRSGHATDTANARCLVCSPTARSLMPGEVMRGEVPDEVFEVDAVKATYALLGGTFDVPCYEPHWKILVEAADSRPDGVTDRNWRCAERAARREIDTFVGEYGGLQQAIEDLAMAVMTGTEIYYGVLRFFNAYGRDWDGRQERLQHAAAGLVLRDAILATHLRDYLSTGAYVNLMYPWVEARVPSPAWMAWRYDDDAAADAVNRYVGWLAQTGSPMYSFGSSANPPGEAVGAVLAGEVVRDGLKAARVSQGEFAQTLNVHVNTVTRWVKDGVPHGKAARVREALDDLASRPAPDDLSGSELAALLEATGVTVLELASACGVSKSTAYRWRERGVETDRVAEVRDALAPESPLVVVAREHVAPGRINGPEFMWMLDESGLSMGEVARRIGLDRSSIAEWRERGVPANRVQEVRAMLMPNP